MDRHEYEINQLINPKKDIVKSNSKHRDNIETLIQGRRIGGIVGGEEPPKNILEDGKYKHDLTDGEKRFFAACTVINGHVFVYAESLGGVNNINVYEPTGTLVARTGGDNTIKEIRESCETYDNFVEVTKEVQLDEQLSDFENYKEL